MLQAGFCTGIDGLRLMISATQAGLRGIHAELKQDDGYGAGSIAISERVEALRLLLSFVDATGSLGWLTAGSDAAIRGLLLTWLARAESPSDTR